MARRTTGGSAELERIAAELDGWRRSPGRGRGIPEGIWRDVVALAQAHGVYRVVRSLRLNYESVKRRVAALAVAPKKRDNAPAFLELGLGSVGGDGSCVVELSAADGVRLTVRGARPEHLSALVESVLSRGR